MTTTKDDLRAWFLRGVNNKQDFMIIVCDTFEWDDYPVYATSGTFKKEYEAHNNQNMQKIMEVYDLNKPVEDQMKGRVMNFPQELLHE